jgi:transposase
MNTENQERRNCKRYDEAFKRNAVELWLQGGKSVAQIARDLGISTQSLRQWKKPLAALPATGPGQRWALQLEAENRRLKRELQHVSRQRDMLKKTPGILSSDGSVSSL